MNISRVALALVIALAPAYASAADPKPSAAPKLSDVPSAAEKPFVDKASKDLEAMYPMAADAEKAGFIRYTYEDPTGAISYANGKWTSTDADHPSQLWYDASGKLIGADYSVPYSDTRPTLFGIDPMRWGSFEQHVHFGVTQPDGTVKYHGTGGERFTKTGGDLVKPTADQLVAAGLAPKASDVKYVFPFPAIWDLEVWLVPNPNGAFADANPNVKPVNPVKDIHT